MTPDPIEDARVAAKSAALAQRRATARVRIRDDAIRRALDAGATAAMLSKVTDLSHSAILKISHQGEPE